MKHTFILLLGAMLSLQGQAQDKQIPFQNTIKVEAGDSHADIIAKAAHVVPSPNQLAALQNEFIASSISPNSFTGLEWGSGKEDPKVFDLKELDTDQWCEAMKAAGMKMVILTVKHHDGFVLWQSRYTKHGIMSTGFRDGKGDILKDLSESCRKYGLKLGVYLSPADLYHIENPEGLYGNLSPYTKRTIPREVPGRPFANKTRFEFVVDDYNEYFLNQLFGDPNRIRPDPRSMVRRGTSQAERRTDLQLSRLENWIKALAPNAVIFGREDVRWCGNEAGGTRSTEWNVIPYQANPDTMSNFADMTDKDLGSREQLYKAKYLHYQQAETNTSIREGWFYRDDTHQKVRSTDDVFDIYERAVGGNSTFLLNIPPNRDGKFSPTDVAVLKETGQRIWETYGTDLFRQAKGPKEVLDQNADTYVTADKDGAGIVISTPQPVTLNRLVLQEAIATNGERVERHAVDAWIDGGWKEIAYATNIGYKRILRFRMSRRTRYGSAYSNPA
ncbi:MAG: alpha-L-fucosidase [Parabacteroides merdae]